MAIDRRRLFVKLARELELGATTSDEVFKREGKPERTLAEDDVTVLEYEAKPGDAELPPAKAGGAPLARFKKIQFLLYQDMLVNVSYAEPEPPIARAALRELLGEPESDMLEDEEEEADEAITDIFEVDVESEPQLSFAAHYDAEEKLEALSLCAEVEGDLEDDDAEE